MFSVRCLRGNAVCSFAGFVALAILDLDNVLAQICDKSRIVSDKLSPTNTKFPEMHMSSFKMNIAVYYVLRIMHTFVDGALMWVDTSYEPHFTPKWSTLPALRQ